MFRRRNPTGSLISSSARLIGGHCISGAGGCISRRTTASRAAFSAMRALAVIGGSPCRTVPLDSLAQTLASKTWKNVMSINEFEAYLGELKKRVKEFAK